MLTLSIIIVNWNVKNYLENCIASLYNTVKNISFEIIVVDNNSIDASVEMIKNKFSQVILIENKENIGFAKANNQAIKESKGEFILLLNPDTIVLKDSILKMYNFLKEHKEAGMVGPKIVDQEGRIRYECARNYNTPFTQFCVLTSLYKRFPQSRIFGHYLMSYWDHNDMREVNAITGACMMIRAGILDDIGLLFDEAFFMYGEDVDTCYRTKKKGWKIYFLPTAQIIHFWNKSAEQIPFKTLIEMHKAIEIFFKKQYGMKAVIRHRIMLILVNVCIQLIAPFVYVFCSRTIKSKVKNIFMRSNAVLRWALNLPK
ncbi:MAG: glycosyltransferase family 2 protein [Candidatus Omnitrophica bacterium]|nr:glycosyltransferase family 2 protein [Candidatus Omnitrophota bacterium]MBU4478286.1 glycosyltransferase family 2 protein [Candidatus Omnitrophota bacterium]MCG2703354.1 glycosyltransferase family 2 protein [Candidatus Omnitrophota bacterium]